MVRQVTIDKLHDMRLSAMADAFEAQCNDQSYDAYFGHIRTLIPGTSGRCFGIIRTAFRLIRTPCRVN